MKNRYQDFTVLLNKITRSIHKIKTEEMNRFDLKSAHVSCLFYLYTSEKPLTSKELCEVCDEDKALISRSLDDLEKKGLVFCEEIKEKRYRSPLHLTQEGNEIGKYVAEKIDNLLEGATQGLSLEQRNAMYEGLEIIRNNLEKMCKRKVDSND
ncbi:MAG: MarR family transcriptional regulator [Anaeroplasmataceae bacterium]|nr:MarR family transcriptional regulator [Anaeroplasmataceae bacterium]MDE6414358.1 MarR family transcriptional regulator [Anaeroplasmataceae bacterium]